MGPLFDQRISARKKPLKAENVLGKAGKELVREKADTSV